jgi:hypothetical protein
MRNQNERSRIKLRLYESIVLNARKEMASGFANIVKPSQRAGLPTAVEQIISVLDNEILDIKNNLKHQENTDTLKERFSSTYLGMTNWGELLNTFDNIFVGVNEFNFMGNVRTENKKERDARLSADKKFFDKINEILSKKKYSKEVFAKAFTAWADELGVSITDENSNNDIINILFKNPTWIKELNELKNGKGNSINVGDTIVSAQIMKEILRFDIIKNTALNKLSNFIGERYSKTATQKDITKILNVAKEQNAILLKEHQLAYLNKIYKEAKKEFVQIKSDKSDAEFKKFYENNINELKSRILALDLDVKGKRPSPPTDLGVNTKNKSRARVDKEISSTLNEKTIQLKSIEDNISFTKDEIRNIKTQIDFQKRRISETKENKTKSKAKVKFEKTDKAIDTNFVLSGFFFRWLLDTVPVERIAGFKGLNEKELKTFNDLFDGSDIYKVDKKTTDIPVIERMIQDLFTSERTQTRDVYGSDAVGLGKYLYDAPDIRGMYDMKSMNTSMLPLQMKKKFIKAMQEALENSDVRKLINDIVMASEWTFNTKYDVPEEMEDVDETTGEALNEIKTLLKNANDRIVKQDNKYIEQSLSEPTNGRKKSANVLKLIESQEDKLSELESRHQKLEEDLQKYEEERKSLKSSIIIAESYINENKISDEIIRQSFMKDSNLPPSIKASIDILTNSVRFRDIASAVAVDHAIDNSTPITIGGGRRPEESSSKTVVPEDRIASLLKIDLSVAMNAFDIQRTENDKGSYEKYAAAAREAYAEDSEVGIKLIESILSTPKDVTVTAEQEFILGIEKARADVFARNAAIKLNDSTLTPEQKEIAEKEFKDARAHIEMVVTATDKATTAVGRSLQALQWGLTKDSMSVSALVKEFERRTKRKIDEETYKAIVELATKWATTKGNLEDLINSFVTEWTKDSFNKPFNDFVSDIASRRNKDKNLSSNARNNVNDVIGRAKRRLKEDPMAPLATVINFRRLINNIATYVVSQDISRPRMAQLDSILAETNNYLSAFGIRLNMEEMEKLWSEYGPIKEQKISDVDARVLELRGIALLDSKLYDVRTNNVPPYKKQKGRTLSPEERERYGLLNDIMIEKKLYSPDDEKDIRVKTPLDRVKSRLLNQIEALTIAIESGVPLRRENAKHVSYDLEAETLKARHEYLKSIYDTLFAPNPSISWEKRVALTEARKQKYLDKLRERIETFKELGVIEKRVKPEEIHTANIDALNAEIKLAQEEFNELTEEYRKKASLLDRYQKQIDALNKELETGVFIKKHKKDFESVKNDPQVQALRKEAKALLIERERQMYQKERESWSVYRKLLEGARDVKDLMKSFRGSLDISSICVQGGLLALSNPKAAKEAVNKAIVAMGNSEKGKAIIQKMLDSDNAKIYQEAGLHIAEYSTETSIYARQEEGVNRNIRLQNLVKRFHNKALDTASKLGDFLIDSSERAFVTPLNVLRIAAFDSICKQAGGVDKLTKTDLQFIASVVNAASGHGDFFGQRGLIAALSKILWSPSRMAGQIETVLLPARLLIKRKELSPGVAGAITAQLIARPALSFAIISGLLALLNSMSDDEEEDDGELIYNKDGTIEWDPRSSKFLRPRLGGRYLTVTGGIEQYLVLAAKIFSGEKKDKYGNIISLSGEGSSNGNQVSDEIIQTMLLNKLSPEISTMMGLMNRKEPFGDKLDTWGKMGWFAIKNTSIPLLLENLYEIYQEEGVDDALIYGALEYIGITSNDYGQSSYSWAESDYRRACKAFDNAKTKEEREEILEQCQFLRQRKDLANIRRAIGKLQEKADAMPPEDREPTVERIKYLQRLFINGLQ